MTHSELESIKLSSKLWASLHKVKPKSVVNWTMKPSSLVNYVAFWSGFGFFCRHFIVVVLKMVDLVEWSFYHFLRKLLHSYLIKTTE